MYRLKADSETREIPVIFLTCQTEVEDETRGFDVGAVDYIHKPFSPAVVEALVQTHLVLRGNRPRPRSWVRSGRRCPDLRSSGSRREESTSGFVGRFPVPSGWSAPAVRAARAVIASMLKIALAGQAAHAVDPAQVLLGLNQALS